MAQGAGEKEEATSGRYQVKSPALKEKPGATWEATEQTDNGGAYSSAESLQASLAQRLNEPVSVSQLLPLVLAKTLVTGYCLREEQP
jgi:hypothetical protein